MTKAAAVSPHQAGTRLSTAGLMEHKDSAMPKVKNVSVKVFLSVNNAPTRDSPGCNVLFIERRSSGDLPFLADGVLRAAFERAGKTRS